jgi:PAB-dependent poly(A)-specific ribonuclease subunit 2
MLKSSRHICAVTPGNSIDILDLHSLKVLRNWTPHGAFINDMDTKNDYIVTCGGSVKQQGQQTYMLDAYVNVFDLKKMASMNPVAFPPLAAYVRMHPRLSSTSIVVSQQGQIHFVDLLNPHTLNIRYANMVALHMVEIASSAEALAVLDAEHIIHILGSRQKCNFNVYSAPMEFASHVEPAPPLDWSVES